MTAETKFNIGDFGYIIIDNKVRKVQIFSVSIYDSLAFEDFHGPEITYEVPSGSNRLLEIKEKDIYKTRQGIAKQSEKNKKLKLSSREEQLKFLENIRSAEDSGALFDLDTLITSTEKAYLLDVHELGEVWIPKTQCKINGNLLFIRNYLIDERGFKDGESMHLKDWEKLTPDHFDIHPKPYRKYSNEEQIENQSNYCSSCMESPCMCSDPY